jgi:hypothetical protein
MAIGFGKGSAEIEKMKTQREIVPGKPAVTQKTEKAARSGSPAFGPAARVASAIRAARSGFRLKSLYFIPNQTAGVEQRAENDECGDDGLNIHKSALLNNRLQNKDFKKKVCDLNSVICNWFQPNPKIFPP